MEDVRKKVMQEAKDLLEDKPETPKEEHAHHEHKAHGCETELKHSKETLMRLQAEFENFRKRTQKEKEELVKSASAQTLKGLLDIVDEFELALASMEKNEQRKGMEMLYGNLMTFLKREGVEPMTTKDTFDPYAHECLKRENGPEGKIITVLKKGYVFRGNVLRHALVIVGNGKQEGN